MTRPAPGRLRPQGAVLSLALAGVLLGWAACRRSSPALTLRVAHESDVITLDPLGPPDSVTNSVLANVYETLVGFDRDMVLVPRLAVAWETTDPTTWVLRLRKGVRFHDGTLLGAHGVRLALERARSDPASALKAALASVKEVREASPDTVRLFTTRVDPLLLNRLAQVPIALSREGGFVGTGPYRIKGWTKGKLLEAQAYPGYWGGPPRFASVEFVHVESGAGVMEALREGAVDVLRFVPENLVEEVRGLPHVRLAARGGLSSTYLWIDTRPKTPRNPFADARVRRAVSLAVDRGALARALSGNALALDQTIPRGIFGHVTTLPPARFDKVEARRLLGEAGWENGFSTPLAHSPGPTGKRMAELVAEMLGAVRIRVTLESPAWEEIINAWREARLPFFLTSWRFDNGDAISFLEDTLVSRNRASGLGENNAGYSNPRLDRLVAESESIVEPAKRMAVYEKIAALLAEEMPVVPLYHRYNLFALSDRIRWEPRLDGRVLVSEIALASDPVRE